MRLTIERDVALKAVTHAGGVVPRNTTIPILSNLLLEAADGRLHLVATDLDIEASEGAPCEVKEAGSVAIPAEPFGDLVRNWPAGGEIELQLKNGRMAISCGRSLATLPTLPAQDFPTLTSDRMAAGGDIPPSAIARLLEKTGYCASTEATRYYLNGVYLHTWKGDDGEMVLRSVATDGHRLAMADAGLPDGFEAWPGLILPNKTHAAMLKMLAGQNDAALRASPERIEAEAGEQRLISKVIDGSFPDYLRVVPRDNPHVVEIDKAALLASLKRAATFADDKAKSLRLTVEAGGLKIAARSAESGEIVEELAADYDGPTIEAGMNARYLADVANHIDGDRLQLHFAEASSPILALDPADKRLRFVLMPQRV